MEKRKVPTFKKGNFITRAADFFKDPLLFLTEKEELLGDFFKVPLLLKPFFIISHPDAIDHILRSNSGNYVKSTLNRQLALGFGNGLITSKGAFYRKQRRLIQPPFRKKNMGHLFGHMLQASSHFLLELEQKAMSEKRIDIVQELKDATAAIAMKTFFSSDKASEQEIMSHILTSGQEYLFSRLEKPYLIPFTYFSKKRKQFYKNKEKFDQIFYRLIAQRRLAKKKPEDLLNTLLEAKDESTGIGMSDEQLRDEMVTLFTAGHETTAIGLSWTLYCLANNPEVLTNLKKELDTWKGKKAIGFKDLSKLSYTRQVIEEGMRLYPPIWGINREAVENDEILGYGIPAGSRIIINIYGLHRNANYWDRPLDFDPGRFQFRNHSGVNDRHYMPFGYGPRTCIGRHFAMTEMILLLANFVQRFNFRLVEDHVVRPKAFMTINPEGGILMHLERA